MKLSYTILPSDNFENLKEFLKIQFQISDRLLLKLKRENKILVNSNSKSINSKVYINDTIEIILDFEEDNSNVLPVEMHLDIIYEDEAYLIINKPIGIPVHPSMEHYKDSLSNGVRNYFDAIRTS